MTRPTLAIHVKSARAIWWRQHLQQLLPHLDCRLGDDIDQPANVAFAVVWNPPQGWLAGFKNLRCIVSVGAGIDHILADKALPKNIPVIRTTSPDLTQRMREYVCLQVLAQHRQLAGTRLSQQKKHWQPIITAPAGKVTVGVMGLGNLGAAAAISLNALGYRVIGWAQRHHQLDGIFSFDKGQKNDFLKQANILVCLLPLTEHTRNILDSSLFNRLPAGAGIVNAARGEHLVETDLLNALNTGQLSHATLDVFRKEPLPTDHPFWSHPKITVTPHIASLIDPESGGKVIAQNINDFINGKTIEDLTDTARGY